MSDKTVFTLSFWRLSFGTLKITFAGLLIFLLGFKTDSWILISFGVLSVPLLVLMILKGLCRPDLILDNAGLSEGKNFFTWQEIRTFNTSGKGSDRLLNLYFEGNWKPFKKTGKPLKDWWRKLFPEERPYSIDISFFKASNDEIEDAMDLYYFPARGYEFDKDDPLYERQKKD